VVRERVTVMAMVMEGGVEIGAALAFIGEKSRGICFSSWDFQNFQIPGEFLSISPHLVGFIKICPDPTPSTRSSLHLAGFTD